MSPVDRLADRGEVRTMSGLDRLAQIAWEYEAPYRALSPEDQRKVEDLHSLVRAFNKAQARALGRATALMTTAGVV